MTQGQTLSVAQANGVLSNDWSGTWSGLAATLTASPSHGNITLNANGSFTYTPTNTFWGTECFSYQAGDGTNSYGSATVTVSVTKSNALFNDDFFRCVGSAISPWQVQMGTWNLVGGVMQGSSPLGEYAFSYLPTVWTNYSVEARVQFAAGAFGGGIGGRLNQSSGAHYAAWVYPEGSVGGSNVLKLVKFTGWTSFSVLATNLLTSVGITNHTIKLTFNTNQVFIYLDNLSTPKISYTDTSSPYNTGSVSLDMWTFTNSYFMTVDDVVVLP